MSFYKLMHKNTQYGVISIHDETGDFQAVKITEQDISPFLGTADEEKMRLWWKMRAVPASRKTMMDVVKKAGCNTSEEYLAKNLALSFTDSYWICPVDADLLWDDVKLWNFTDKGVYEIPYHNVSSYDPNATLGGQMEKYWEIKEELELIKKCYIQNGQQAVNEVFAALVHSRQNIIPYTEYQLIKNDDGLAVKCKAFTSEDIELVPAYEVLKSRRIQNDKSEYENYIQICKINGIPEEIIRDFMDYQTITDFVISNSDRHLMNFGVLRDSNTNKLIGPAPIYDNGNSMFLNENKIYNRITILERDITSFYTKEEKMLKNVVNRNIVDISKLPTINELITIYKKAGISLEKCNIIASNYNIKLEMVKDFQNGKTISLFTEKQRQKKTIQNTEK